MKSQQRQDTSDGRLYSGGGHFSMISATNQPVFILVARCGSVADNPDEPGPRYVVNIGRPVNSCKTVTPALHTSMASVWMPCSPRTSGAMYKNVPASVEGASRRSAHHPKSAILKVPSTAMSKFSGFMSLWSIPKQCKSRKPEYNCRVHTAASLSHKRLSI